MIGARGSNIYVKKSKTVKSQRLVKSEKGPEEYLLKAMTSRKSRSTTKRKGVGITGRAKADKN